MRPAKVQSLPRIRREWLVAIALAALVGMVFAHAVDCLFVNLDDPDYVTANPHVKAGLNAEGIRWAFTAFAAGNWHPLTWMSLQLDASLWKAPDGNPDPWGFHLTNVLVHAASAALLFLALRSLTGAFWQSAVAAALFGVHPLRVESVAWIAERKDVLSVFFGMATLWAYGVYARQPSKARYFTVVAAFAASLLCKGMLVTLPCLLLVLDWWPLKRAETFRSWRSLGFEKLPLLALSAASSAVIYRAQSTGGAVVGLDLIPLHARVENVSISYVTYLWKTVWPTSLAVYQPHVYFPWGGGLSHVEAAVSTLVLIAVTAGAITLRRRAPYVLAGWLWYLGTLVPVIGLIQAGDQAYADRFTYFPQVGILIAVCWGVADLARRWPQRALAAAALATVVLAVLTHNQLKTWENSITLWDHDLRVARESPIALMDLGVVLGEQDRVTEAEQKLRRAIEIRPNTPLPHINLGTIYARKNRLDEAASEFRAACDSSPTYAQPRVQLGEMLLRQRKLDEAEDALKEAIRLDPQLSSAHCNMGMVAMARGNLERAADEFREAVRLQENSAEAHCGLGAVLIGLGRKDDGLAELRQAVQCNPHNADAHLYLAIELEARRDWENAISHFKQATDYGPALPMAWFGLGKAQVRYRLYRDAMQSFEKAVELDPESPNYRRALDEFRIHLATRQPNAR